MKMQEILQNSWLTSDPLDYEYKKYLILAYEQAMMKHFNKDKLYPYAIDILDKLTYVDSFLKGIKIFEDSAKEVEKIDWLKKELIYKPKFIDETFLELKQIATYSQYILNNLSTSFNNLYDDVDSSIVITGNRYSLFDTHSGYMIVKYGQKERIVSYEIYKTIYPEPVFHLKTSKASNMDYYSNRYTRNLFEIWLNEPFPLKETLIPVARRKFLMHVLGSV